MHVFYLHGFASSPGSSKAVRIAERLARYGVPLHRPDFNQPDFSTLTLSRMIEQTRRAIRALPPAPVVLIGSSLGGLAALYVAAQAGDEGRRVARLILLAPALDFGRARLRELGPAGLARWRETDRLDVYHYGEGKMRFVRYTLYEDALQYDAAAVHLDRPTLIFQGRRDTAVDPAEVERFARAQPHVRLRMLDDDHQLLASLPVILDEIEVFLGLRRT